MVSHRHRAGFCNAPHASASVAESTDVRPCETRRRGTLEGCAARSLRRSADVAHMWSARCERIGTPAVSASHSPNAGVLLAHHPSLEKRRNTSDEWVWRRRMIIRRPVFRPVSAGSAMSRWRTRSRRSSASPSPSSRSRSCPHGRSACGSPRERRRRRRRSECP